MDINITEQLLQDGIILPFDKPYKWTSFFLVNKIRYYLCKHYGLKKLKVGHAGTLDPLATGLLILCTGKATKIITEIQDMPKEYFAEITLGATTPSFDLETEIDSKHNTNHLNKGLIEKTIKKYRGKIEQVPPLFSAKNVNGVRAYELARDGIKKELKPSTVEIYSIDIVDFVKPVLKIKIKCSKGTYIRSLARDIGVDLNTGGHLTSLRREAIGNYRVENAIQAQDFLKI